MPQGASRKRAAGLAALFCLLVVFYNAFTAGLQGQFTPEFFLFVIFFFIFGALWLYLRNA